MEQTVVNTEQTVVEDCEAPATADPRPIIQRQCSGAKELPRCCGFGDDQHEILGGADLVVSA